MALAKCQITVELREILLKDRPNLLYKISPKGTVPVLQLDKFNVMDESLDIMLWALKNSNNDWLDINQSKQLNMINHNDTKFKYWLDRYKYSEQYPEFNFKHYQNACGEFLSLYNIILKDNLFLMGEKYQLVDIGIFPFIRQCAYVDSDWFSVNFTHLNSWLNKIKISELFLSVMKKYKVWVQNSNSQLVKFIE